MMRGPSRRLRWAIVIVAVSAASAASAGIPIATFDKGGVVDLKLDNDLVTSELGLNATPLAAGDVVVVGAPRRRFAENSEQRQGLRARVRRADRQTAVDLSHHPEAR